MICVQSPSEPTTFTSCPGYRVPRTEPFVLASERTFTPSVAVAVPLAAPLEDDAEDEDDEDSVEASSEAPIPWDSR